jgi:hypothetical protein
MKSKSVSPRAPVPTADANPACTIKPACDAHGAEMLLACRPRPLVVTPNGLDSATRVTQPTARMGIELVIPVENNPGVLAQVLRSMAGRKVNILAYCTSFDLDRFTILLVTDAILAAKTALAEAGLNCTARSVVLVRIRRTRVKPTACVPLRALSLAPCLAGALRTGTGTASPSGRSRLSEIHGALLTLRVTLLCEHH